MFFSLFSLLAHISYITETLCVFYKKSGEALLNESVILLAKCNDFLKFAAPVLIDIDIPIPHLC